MDLRLLKTRFCKEHRHTERGSTRPIHYSVSSSLVGYSTYLPTAERREQIAHRWAPLPVCLKPSVGTGTCVCSCCICVCCPFAWVWFYPNMYYACMCAFAIQRTATDHVCLPLPFPLILSCKALCVKLWDVSSGVWLRGDLRCSNIQVWDLSLSLSLSFCGIKLRWKRSTLQTPDKRHSYTWYRESSSTCRIEARSVIN